jgi:disulfide bond formation protein DsbB
LKIIETVFSTRARLAGITTLASVALFSSLYLQYVALYQPCRYCLVLRYLTAAILVVSLVAQVRLSLAQSITALISGAGLVGVGVSTFLIFDELYPSAAICTSCTFSPFIAGISLYYYSFVYMALVLGLAVSIVLKGEEGP